ncbi:Fip1 domain-containing protein [Heracleum sosnowskyi]|uniref:Fip1 domain-containing protein n=1 Tax=Heracleum sosnowskyi TaxID=360622 RepID=A0AAD8IPU3_9APIA|nr:Fip1 domain-containing protein [Heracleum sosnowskyi]
MEDDEFGDLYTDVLTSFTNSSSFPVQNTVSVNNDGKNNPNLTKFNGANSGSEFNRIKLDEPARVLEIDSTVNLPDNRNLRFEDPNLIDESLINVIEDDANGDVDVLDVGIGDSVIPGLSNDGNGGDFREGDDDWDSDSDSDGGLVIVLNEYNEYRNGQLRDGEDVDEDGNILVVRDEDVEKQEMEEDEWGEGGEGGEVHRFRDDVEMMDLGDGLVKVMEVVRPPKNEFGYNNQFHSQFKYMRPGAASLASGGPSSQVSASLIVGLTPGHGRGDWRPLGLKNAPPMQNGMPVWANNNPGHGFGRGLDFTLPSHKTVFEVDIDSFEEKPWRLHGIDISDFFNFGLNEDSWKEYCKQLEQLRLEAIMQSKIRVYESGRTEQEQLRLEATMQSKIQVYESGRTEQKYDPDLPPELAAAAGIHEISADNTNLEKAKVGHSDAATAWPQLQTGRAIQVETCYSDRLPSIDTRPPRIRDSDAIIEIVLQDSADDDSVNGNDITELPEDTSREGLRSSHDIEEDNAQEDTEILYSAPEAYNYRKRELSRRKIPLNKSVHGRVIGDGLSRVMLEAPVQNPSSSAEKNSVYSGPLQDERGRKGRIDRSLSIIHSGSTRDKRRLRNQKDESAENVGLQRSPDFSSRHTREVTEEQCYKEEDSIHDEHLNGSFELDRVDVDLDVEDAHKDKNSAQYLKKQKINLRYEQSLEDVDDREGSKAARSSRNSKAISGSTSDYRNLPYGTEVVQDGRYTRMGIKNKVNDGDHRSCSKGREERQDMDRHHMVIKGREDPYYPKNWDYDRTYHSRLKADFIDRRKESDNSGGSWLRKDEESHGIRTRVEDSRKRDYGNEMGHRHWSKVREIERNDLDQCQLRKQLELDNGGWTGSYHDKYMGSRHWDRDHKLKSRSVNFDDLYGKRRKDVDLKRDCGENKDLMHVYRENTSLHKRERDEIMEQRRRNDMARIRNVDQQSVRHREEIWFPRERVDRQRNDWQRLQSHEETLSKRERGDVLGVKTGRTGEEKSWASQFRAKDELKGGREYRLKDPGNHSEQYKRKERVQTERFSHKRGGEDMYSWETRPNTDERRSRQERLSARTDPALNAFEHQRMLEKKHKEYPRKMKESEEDHKSVVHSRRIQDGYNSQISKPVKIKGMIEQGSGDQVIPVSHQSSRKRKKDASSDDEQHELMRGRPKLERWTSHKEGDFNGGTKLSSLNVKEIDDHKGGTLVANTVPDEPSKTVETGEYPHSLSSERDVDDQVNKDGEVKPEEDIHLDSVAKLKKRSERLKLLMPSEKEFGAVKKIGNKQLPPYQTGSRTDSEIKQERPVRKRRWSGN